MKLSLLILLLGCGGKAAVDEDGDGVSVDDGDCDDLDAAISPDAEERCDGVDEDCDGRVDEDALDGILAFVDGDGDGFGAGEAVATCALGEGFAALDGDCDDAEAAVAPGVEELCDELDNDCNGAVDDVAEPPLWLPDEDGDGWGADGEGVGACSGPSGSVDQGGDCDDADPLAFPGAPELCDDVDQDCDGAVDEGRPVTHVDPEGVATSYTAAFAGGSSSSPAELLIAQDGVVYLCEGAWFVSLRIDGEVSLLGAGAELSTLNGGGRARVIDTTTGSVVGVEGVAVQQGAAREGAGVRCGGASLLMREVEVSGGEAEIYGGGVYADEACDLELVDVMIRDNEAGNGGGGLWFAGGALRYSGGAVSGNLAGSEAGGVGIEGAQSATLTNVDVRSNEATDGGGLVVRATPITLDGVSVLDNVASDDGGGARFSGLEATLSGVEVSGNVAGSVGGGLLLTSDAHLVVSGSDISDNVAALGGGAYVDSSSSLQSVSSYWGGNSPYDLFSASRYSYGTTASFLCDSAGCR